MNVRVGRAADGRRTGGGLACRSWMRLLRGVVKVGMRVSLLGMELDNQCSKLMDAAQVLASNGVSSNHLLRAYRHEANVFENSQ